MQDFLIPVCYFPSTALFIDDHRDFLLNVILQLDEGLAYRVVTSPFEALACIEKKRCEIKSLSRQCDAEYRVTQHADHTNQAAYFNLAMIYAEIFNPQRFDEISVLVVDYAMEGMDGLLFFQAFTDMTIKKILLVDEQEEALAKKAMNDRIIHRYILKSAADAARQITQSIHELQRIYFHEMSAGIIRVLSLDLPPCFFDKKFADFFEKFCQRNGIVEYYLMDTSGNFLLLDAEANTTGLMIKAKTDSANDQWFQWTTCLLSEHQLDAENTYFYAQVQGDVLLDLHAKKIQSYHRHLEELEMEELLFR